VTPAWATNAAALRTRRRWTVLRVIHTIEPAVAAMALLALAPLMISIALIISVLARRCPLVRHTRVGWRGVPLRVLKFRTMWERGGPRSSLFAIEDVAGNIPPEKTARDPRVTSRFAAWCRRHSLDELPQLVNVARREMSFVGPRPITRGELDSYYGKSTGEVLSKRPGLVGLWQVLGRNRLSYAQRRRLDVFLVRRSSTKLYVRILLRAVPLILVGDGAY
jgi:exopolysaccharide production protein ExoY